MHQLTTIIHREMLDHIKSLKFLIAFGVAIVLMALATVINLNDYRIRSEEYTIAVSEKQDDPSRMTVYRKPEPLSVMVIGKERKMGTAAESAYRHIAHEATGYMIWGGSEHKRIEAEFTAVDVAFVVQVILSLMVIFIGYQAIAGEKERGTLRLMMANKLPRDTVLIGKFFGGMAVVGIAAVAAGAVTGILIAFHPSVDIGGDEMGRIALMALASLLYLGVWYVLSMLVSVLVNRSSTALMVLLQIWVVMVVLVPNAGSILAERFVDVPSEEEIRAMHSEILNRHDELMNPHWEERQNLVMRHRENGTSTLDDPRYTAVVGIMNEMHAQCARERLAVDRDFRLKKTRQGRIARLISSVSPASVYNVAMTRLARTGEEAYDRFLDAIPGYWDRFNERRSLLYSDREAYREYKIGQFSIPEEPFQRALIGVLPGMLLMFAGGVAMFAGTYAAFLRKDVR